MRFFLHVSLPEEKRKTQLSGLSAVTTLLFLFQRREWLFFPGLPTTTLQPAWAYTFNGLIFNEPSCQLIITHNFSMYIALPCPAAAHSNHCIHITLTPENSLHLTIVEKMISSRWNY